MTFINDVAWLKKEKYDYVESEAFLLDVKRLENGEPLAYLIGNVPFLNTIIYLDSHPLIPRPETEYWTELAIKEIQNIIKSNNAPAKILDLCAGSGCVGVAVAKNLPLTAVDFIELDEGHLATIRKNCKENNLKPERTRIMSGDLNDLKQTVPDTKYDFILSNPPYIDKELVRTELSVTNHEPALALYGGKDGLEFIKAIIEQAPSHLLAGGQLWLEHEPEQVEAIANLSAQHGFKPLTHPDQFGVPRFSQLMLQ
ncbi:MAG TPA: peptide chain release factor N(5)-glutamine methyltransferase [Candidatus Paceibacterota bacterium]|nr:peptide chain release factor N(5)-glutamine methyltransferase [Candidatus Paceibacterota bacterium]HMO83188.1 peptide chain release factor N(5)-glutamine methyltransferase [Candidatus Paceibacterota bacterium]